MKQYDIKLIRDRKKEIDELFKVAANSGEAYPNVGEDYVMVVDAAARLADWAERVFNEMTAAVEYNRASIRHWSECDPGCECYVCEMEKLIAELKGAA